MSRSQESALSVERLVVKTRSRLRRTFQHTCRGGLLKQQSTMQRIALAALDLNFAASSTMGRVELPIASRSVSCASVPWPANEMTTTSSNVELASVRSN